MKKEIIKGITKGLKYGTNTGLDILAERRPEFEVPVAFVKAFFGILGDLKQDRINEFVESIRDNPGRFAEEVVKIPASQEGFVITFEAYMKQRMESKSKIIQRIFIGFTASKDKESFEIERMYNTVSLLSVEGIMLLKDLKNRVIPEIYRKLEEEVKQKSEKSDVIDNYIFIADILEYLKAHAEEQNKDIRLKILSKRNERITELVSLGLLKSGISSENGGVTITRYCLDFIKFIDDAK